MDLKRIKTVGGALVLATNAEVSEAESQLWVTFPQGYRAYVTTLGEGVLGGSFVRVYPPWRILKELNEWRDRIRRYWFWEKGRKLLPKERALESVIAGDTANGDELLFHPSKPDRLFVLPRESEKIYEAGPDLLAAVEWMCDSGKLTKRFKERIFEPFDSRAQSPPPAGSAGTTGAGSEQTLEEVVATLRKWAEKHDLTKAAQKSLKEWIVEQDEPLFGRDKKEVKKGKIKATFKDHILVFQPEKYSEPCVKTTLTLIDSETGYHFGEFQLLTGVDGTMQGYGVELTLLVAEALAEGFLGRHET